MAEREDPLVGFHFSVDIQGVVKGYFTEVTGLGSETELIESKVVNEKGKDIVVKVPGRLKWDNIVLKRGITSSMDVWKWRKAVEDGDVDKNRHDGSITMYDQQLKPVAIWNFYKAWPSKVTGPQPKADSNQIGIEEMTIVHEYIVRTK
jgi:phage tail-like protein